MKTYIIFTTIIALFIIGAAIVTGSILSLMESGISFWRYILQCLFGIFLMWVAAYLYEK